VTRFQHSLDVPATSGDASVSVIIPAFNAARFIRRAIDSVIGQSYRNLEIIVVDDGSTDNTSAIVRSIGDSRIRSFRQPNAGQGAARNRGIEHALGAYITFLDADDFYLSDKVGKQAAFLSGHPACASVYCNAVHFFSAEPSVLYKSRNTGLPADVLGALLRCSLINPNTFMCRSEALRSVGGFKEGAYGRYSEEWDLYIRLATAGHRFGRIDEELVAVEIRPDSNTTWDVQWIIKRNSLEMLEGVFARMELELRRHYRCDGHLRRQRIKLLIAHLIARHRQEASDRLRDLGLAPWLRIAIEAAIRIAPADLIRHVLIGAWKRRRRLNWERVRDESIAAQIAAVTE
jgi:glycosyltransferase involved in cell wall biosynthesis